MSNLVKFAENELRLAGLIGSSEEADQEMARCVLELVNTFANQGHSGVSAGYCLALAHKLLKFEPITPLTGSEEEWVDVSGYCDGKTMFQNKRCGRVFKELIEDGSELVYDIGGIVFIDKQGLGFTNSNSRVEVTFPYTPTTRYVKVDE